MPLLTQASRRESETLTKFAEDFGCRSYGSYEAMAEDAEVDIVYVAVRECEGAYPRRLTALSTPFRQRRCG